MSSESCILVLNSGSSSIKFAIYIGNNGKIAGRGAITGIGTKPIMSAKGELFSSKDHASPILGDDCKTTTDAARILIAWLETCLPEGGLTAVGHRVVHGGDMPRHSLITADILAYLKTLIPLAPLHQPYNLESIDIILRLHPHVPQVACFDTAFHATIPPLHRRFALPRKWSDKGIKRYGFHGLSYEYIASRIKELSPKAYERSAIIAHLGNGASLCALKGGQSFETTMGFSVLDGLVMGTRPGNMDAGVLLYFMRAEGLDEAAIEHMLYHESGLLGASGISNDMATLLASTEPAAKEAVDLFCHRITREAGACVSLMGGFDALVFTGGIGEHAAAIRAQVSKSLSWAGLEFDDAKNEAADGSKEVLLSTPRSMVDVWLVPTDEEGVICRHTRLGAGING